MPLLDRWRLGRIKNELSAVSPSFCLAKWLQVTLYLYNGRTHSCHHPATHAIPLDELRRDPSALHNTSHKKSCRQQMLKGEAPAECSYCWKVEKLPGRHFSDRHLKSNAPWAKPFFEQVRALPWDAHVNPTYLEVSFSHACNFRCAYCSPRISSSIEKEIRKFGAYPTSDSFGRIEPGEVIASADGSENPYTEAFWAWLPEIYPGLKVFRITGGEPLLSPDTFSALDYVERNPNPHLQLAINSNLGVPRAAVDKFIAQLKRIQAKGAVREIRIYTSLDTFGPQAEYLRSGLDSASFAKNISDLLDEIPGLKIVVMCTFNVLSIPKFTEFLRFVRGLKRKHKSRFWPFGQRVILDISHLENPDFLSARIADAKMRDFARRSLRYMRRNPLDFSFQEINKLRRILALMSEPLEARDLERRRSDFKKFIDEYDRRKNLRFAEAFPELETFHRESPA